MTERKGRGEHPDNELPEVERPGLHPDHNLPERGQEGFDRPNQDLPSGAHPNHGLPGDVARPKVGATDYAEFETATGAAPTHTDLANAPQAPASGEEGGVLTESEVTPPSYDLRDENLLKVPPVDDGDDEEEEVEEDVEEDDPDEPTKKRTVKKKVKRKVAKKK